jgi:hypothetical protein
MEPFDLHRLGPDNIYSEPGSVSYTPTTTELNPQATGFATNVKFPQMTFSEPPTAPPLISRPQFSNSIIQPPVYNGLTDPLLWLKEYELTSSANNWDDRLKVKRLIGSLTGAPKLYYISALDSNPNLTWFEFRSGLIGRFTNTNESDTSIASILSKKQRDNETFNDYWFSKLQLIETKRPNLPVADKKHLLLEGLKPGLHGRVMEKLIIRPTDNLDELRDIAKQTSDLMQSRQPNFLADYKRKSRNEYGFYAEGGANQTYPRRFQNQQFNKNTNFVPRQQFNRRNNVTNVPDNNRSSQRNNNEDINQITKQINDLKSVMMRQQRQVDSRNQTPNPIREKFYYNRGGQIKVGPNRDQTRQEKVEKKDTKIICFNCQEAGHIATNCPLKNTKSNLNRNNERSLNNKQNSKNANQQKF